MFTHIQKRHFIFVVRALLITLSLLSAAASHGQTEKNDAQLPPPSITPAGSNLASLEQTLVPESVFAMQLAEAIKLGPMPDETEALERLSNLGIEPRNGWIAEYPVTPEVLGDIEKGIATASDQGKIALTKDQALKLFHDVKTRLGFDINPGSNPPEVLVKKSGKTMIYMYTDNKGVTHYTDDHDSIPKENLKKMKVISQSMPNQLSDGAGSGTTQPPLPQYIAKSDPEVIDKQYYEQGPPVVTYYTPPDSYNYLYSWIPYPFWSTGSYYPGFFILNDFHRHVYVNKHPHYVTHHHRNGSDFSRSGPPGQVNRGFHGPLKSDGMNHLRGFSTPKAQAGAKAIIGGNINRNRLPKGMAESRWDTSRMPFSSGGNARAFSNPSVVPDSRIKMQNTPIRQNPYSGERFLNQRNNVPSAPRIYSSPAFAQERDVRSSTRSYGGNASGGFQRGGTVRGFQGGGNFPGHGGGYSSGSSRGGHR